MRIGDVSETDGRVVARSSLGFGVLGEERIQGEEELESALVGHCQGEITGSCYCPAVDGFEGVDVCYGDM